MWLQGILHTSLSQSKAKIHLPPYFTSLNFLTCEVEEKQRNEVTDWGRQPKNTSCKFLLSPWFTYHSGPGKTTRGFISNPAQVQSGCWEVGEVSMASKDFHKEYFWEFTFHKIFLGVWGVDWYWQTYVTEISGKFFFLLTPLLYICLWIAYQSLYWFCYKCMLRRKTKALRGSPPKYAWIVILTKYCTWNACPLIKKQTIR